jgi:HAD superfamily hydrolase (TIGR01509 family)
MPGSRAAPSRVHAVLFDWDGTLLNSYEADAASYEAMFHAIGIRWGRAELRLHYSPDWHRVYRAAGIPETRWREADRLWGAHYDRLRPALLPGARRVLGELAARFTLGLVSSGTRCRILRQIARFDLRRFFAARICSEDAPRRKPHPAGLWLALQRMGVSAAHAVYVGDSPEDVSMARRAGVRAIGILGPFPNHERLRAARPLVLLDSISALPALLRRL